MTRLFAHVDQPLVDHLRDVAHLAQGFARAFAAERHGFIAGLLHDLGKAEPEFQKRIRTNEKEGRKEPHAHHGAMLAAEAGAWPVAICINGHHAGLHNRGDVDSKRSAWLERAKQCLATISSDDPGWNVPELSSELPAWLSSMTFDQRKTSEGWFAVDLFTRFLFSALVDADSLNTEQHEVGRDASVSRRRWPEFDAGHLLKVLKENLAERRNAAERDQTASAELLQVWREVADCCEAAAAGPRGLFSLTVPTGGGKTLASMLFALAHAAGHNRESLDTRPFRRVIVVIPYLSIIQQTVKELRDVFGYDWILEHHSQADEEKQDKKHEEPTYGKKSDRYSLRRRLAAENWDAPVIVTTSVQFFGSLFSRKRSAARKLHNICQSVLIFDEVQTLPPLLLQPILSVLKELCDPSRPYGCTALFCTATQPALAKNDDLPCGFSSIKPVVSPDKARDHFQILDRVDYQWPGEGEQLTWQHVAEELIATPERQALVVVNTRQAARDLHAVIAEHLKPDQTSLFHLSTWMIPAHRDAVLEEVRRRLKSREKDVPVEPCFLVSTQCVEAGVDVDFPRVWRAFGPYDSIVQAAGRCNRRGMLRKGTVRVFHPSEAKLPKGLYQTATSQTELLRQIGRAIPRDPDSFTDYFRLLYQLSVPDDCAVQQARANLRFQEVHELFEFIEENTFHVLVLRQTMDGQERDTLANPVYEAARKRGFLLREDWRSFQPFLINLLHSARTNSVFKDFIQPSFDSDSGLYVWTGVYEAGLHGVGIRPVVAEDCII